jgi:DUF177 domain-containing protein
MREQTLTVPAPEDLGVEMVGVPAGADIELDLRFEAVMEGVLVTGTARMPLTGECARCLDPIATTFEADFQELFCYPDTRSGGEAGEDEHQLVDDLIDLEPVLRDAVVLNLPLSPLCGEDCPGLCADCGERLADLGPDHRHEAVDSRWAALRALQDDASSHPRGSSENS